MIVSLHRAEELNQSNAITIKNKMKNTALSPNFVIESLNQSRSNAILRFFSSPVEVNNSTTCKGYYEFS